MIEGILAADHADDVGLAPRPLGYLVPRQGATIRARLHPWAIAGVWAWQAAFALLAAYPAAALVAEAYGGDPRGDAPLGAPGGHALLDLLNHDAHGAIAAAAAAALILVAAAFAGLAPLAALLTAMAHATHGGRPIGAARAFAGGVRSLRALAPLFVAAGAAEALAGTAAIVAGRVAEAAAHAWLGEARAQMLGIAVALVALAPACALGVVHDLARAAAVRFQLGGLGAWVTGARAFRAAPARLAWSWAWRGAASLAPIAAVAALSDRIGWRAGAPLLALAVLHQGAALTRTALRASWLARALRAVDASPLIPPPGGASAAA